MKYICELCGTIYVEEEGNLKRGIAPGTPFDKLPSHYNCPHCGSEKEAFTLLPEHKQAAAIQQPVPSQQYKKYIDTKAESER